MKLFKLSSLFLALLWIGDAKAISISPPVMEIEIDPGGSVERTIEIGNETNEERVYNVGVKKFEMVGEEGRQRFIPIEEGDDFELASWIKYEENKIIISPKSSKKFAFTVNVPENADPGGRYASIYFSAGQPAAEGNGSSRVGVEAQINALILARISGEITEKAEIESFGLKDNESFFNRLPVTFVWKLKNEGNVHIRAQGNIEIKDIVGRRVELLDANPKNYRVLPGNTRKIDSWWGGEPEIASGDYAKDFLWEAGKEFENFAFGKYSAKLDIVYGKGNKNFLSREISFWVIPWRAILLAGTAFVVLMLAVVLFVKKYNKWIVKRHLENRK